MAAPTPRAAEASFALFDGLAAAEAVVSTPGPAAIDWAALSAPAPPLPSVFDGRETGLFTPPREVPPQAFRPTNMHPPTPVTESAAVPLEFTLFANSAQERDFPPATTLALAPAPAGSTMSRLKHVVNHAGPASLPQPVSGGASHHTHSAPGGQYGSAGTSLPAAAVTVPLGEVMRLVATGGPPVASPFDTFRAALRTPSPY